MDQDIQTRNEEALAPLAHYLVMIVDETDLLRKCFNSENYKPLSAMKEI